MILRSAHTYKKLEQLGGDPSKLDIPKQTVAVLYSVQAIIDSGGFLYLFENDFPLNPPYSQFVDAYRRLGSNEAAVRLEKAVAMFPFKDPHHLPNRLRPRHRRRIRTLPKSGSSSPRPTQVPSSFISQRTVCHETAPSISEHGTKAQTLQGIGRNAQGNGIERIRKDEKAG